MTEYALLESEELEEGLYILLVEKGLDTVAVMGEERTRRG